MDNEPLNRIAHCRVEMANPGMWADMSDKQKAAARRDVWQVMTAALMCGYSWRGHVTVSVDQDVDQHQTLA
jgi:hypothetical protein